MPHDVESGEELGRALLDLWPSYLAFLTSFGTIGVLWINHHKLFTYVRRVDHALLIYNTLLLLGITFLPFPRPFWPSISPATSLGPRAWLLWSTVARAL